MKTSVVFPEISASGVTDRRTGLEHKRGKREAAGTRAFCQVCISQDTWNPRMIKLQVSFIGPSSAFYRKGNLLLRQILGQILITSFPVFPEAWESGLQSHFLFTTHCILLPFLPLAHCDHDRIPKPLVSEVGVESFRNKGEP